MRTILFILLTVFIFSSCGKKSDSTKTDIKQTTTDTKTTDESVIKFSDKSFMKSYKNCTQNDTCTYFKVDYLEAVSGKNKDKVNKLIMNIVNSGVSYGDKSLPSMDVAADSFLTQYVSFRKEFPETALFWYLELSVKQANETPKIMTFSSENSSFMGGAHPNTYFYYTNISKETGDTISLSNLFTAGFEKKLNELIDAAYRKMKNLKPGDNLQDKGDLFENKIAFNYNFMVTKDGTITFYYNPYEIAAYVVGPIEITLTKDEIAPLVAENSLLK